LFPFVPNAVKEWLAAIRKINTKKKNCFENLKLKKKSLQKLKFDVVELQPCQIVIAIVQFPCSLQFGNS